MQRIKRKSPPRAKLAESHYQQLARAYEHFNATLFDGILPPVEGTAEAKDAEVVLIFTAARKANSMGYFAPDRWDQRSGDGKTVHEINVNPDSMYNKPDDDICSTVVHEQVHLWQHLHADNPPNRAYHNREWSNKMIAIGLMPSNTGMPGGKTVGAKMSHYIIRGGAFAKAFKQLADTGFKFELESKAYAAKERKPSSKNDFVCRHGHQKCWGKDSLALSCNTCLDQVIEKLPDEETREAMRRLVKACTLLDKEGVAAWQKLQAQGGERKRIERPKPAVQAPHQRKRRKAA
jgi:hypothetical protein